MKRVLIISAVYPPEPVVSARLSSDLYHSLKGKGYKVSVLHPKPSRPNGFDFGGCINRSVDEIVADSYTCPHSSLFGRIRESYSFGKACKQYIRENHNELSCVYANTWPMFSQRAVVKASQKYSVPVAIHVQDVYPESLTNKIPTFVGKLLKGLLLPMDKYILRNCNKVIVISDKMKDYLVKTRRIEEGKISVVINWQDETDFLEYQTNNTPEKHEKFTFMYMGNIGPVAGVDLLIDAFEHSNLEGARLVIAGSGSMKDSLKEKAKNNQSIEFWDVPNGKVPEIQSKADVMLLPIKRGAASSSIPSKLPAYMFSAKPVIGCMDVDSYTAEAIMSSKGGYVIEPENLQMLSEMMEKMIAKDYSELEKMGKEGQQYALNHFAKTANLAMLVKEVEGIL